MPACFPSNLLFRLILSGCCLSAFGCEKPQRIEVTGSRKLFTGEGVPKLGLSSAQRYAANDAQGMLRWDTPAGWNFLPATEFRHINFNFGPQREGEIYLTLLPVSAGGGVLDNFNRWRKQMGQEPITEENLAALPVKTIFTRPVPYLDITGTYTGGSGPMMQPGAAKPDYRMIGTIFEAPGFLFTIKMTGPAALVAQNEAKFNAFCQSLAAAAPPGGA